MLVADILHSCANERVAEAAVVSIGGDFALRLRFMAGRCGTSVGSLAASLVRRFAVEAGERDWRRITLLMSGSDLPVLCGLRAIVESALRRNAIEIEIADPDQDKDGALPAWIAHPQPARERCLAC